MSEKEHQKHLRESFKEKCGYFQQRIDEALETIEYVESMTDAELRYAANAEYQRILSEMDERQLYLDTLDISNSTYKNYILECNRQRTDLQCESPEIYKKKQLKQAENQYQKYHHEIAVHKYMHGPEVYGEIIPIELHPKYVQT